MLNPRINEITDVREFVEMSMNLFPLIIMTQNEEKFLEEYHILACKARELTGKSSANVYAVMRGYCFDECERCGKQDYERFRRIDRAERSLIFSEIEVTAENIASGELFYALDGFEFDSDFEFESCVNILRSKAKKLHMTTEFDRISKAFINSRTKKRENDEKTGSNYNTDTYIDWVCHNQNGGVYINEPLFIEQFIAERELRCIQGQFYGIDGLIPADEIKHTIQNLISEHIVKNIAKVTENLFRGLINFCYSEPMKAHKDEIHVQNGILYTNGTFVPNKKFCISRLDVNYCPTAPKPEKWLKYLDELLEPDDIPTLQEFIGYCLIPSTKAQTMLFLIGSGGEGKGVTGEVLSAMFRNSMVTGKIQKIATDRFIGADLENKLLFLDDDLNFNAMPDTGMLKSLVTANTPFRIERKYADKYDAYLYTRLICFGNNCLNSLYDHTDGFYRRQLIIRTKPKRKGRIDNPMLAGEIISEELDSVFLWAFEGLQRLIRNNFELTVSEKSRKALNEAKAENFNFELFLREEAVFADNYEITTADLYNTYCCWCGDNGFTMFKRESIVRYMKNNTEKLGIEYSQHCKNHAGREARGFRGIRTRYKFSPTI